MSGIQVVDKRQSAESSKSQMCRCADDWMSGRTVVWLPFNVPWSFNHYRRTFLFIQLEFIQYGELTA